MPDRSGALLVTLSEDVRADDLEEIVALLKLVRGVVDVRPVLSGVALEELSVTMRERAALREKLIALVRELQ